MEFFSKESQNSSRYLCFLFEQMDEFLSKLLLDKHVSKKLPTNILDAMRRLLFSLKKKLFEGYNNSISHNTQIRSLFQATIDGNSELKITKRHIENAFEEFEGSFILLEGLASGAFLEENDMESIRRLQVFLKNLSSSEVLKMYESIIAF